MKTIYLAITFMLIAVGVSAGELDVTVSADSYIRGGSDYENVNYGSDTLLWIKNHASDAYIRKALFKFDLSVQDLIPAGETISKAVLKLTFHYIDGAGIPFRAYAIADDSWTESAVTWNNAPLIGEAISDIYTSTERSTSPVEVEFDITEFVLNEFLGDNNKLVSIAIYGTEAGGHLKIASKEASMEPVLHISSEIVTIPAAPTELTVSNLSAQVVKLNWTDNSNDELGFYIERKEGSGDFAQIAKLNKDEVSYFDYYLNAESIYSYRVRSYNGAGESGYSAEENITLPGLSRLTYYIDASSGSDENDGLSEAGAWQSSNKISEMPFSAGTSLLFKRGEIWDSVSIDLQCNSTKEFPTIIGAYGTGAKPVLNGSGIQTETINIHNLSYVEISDLEVSNFGKAGGAKVAIYISGKNIGKIEHIHLKNLKINKVNSSNSDTYKNYGGIYFEVLNGNDQTTWFNDVLVEGCVFDSIARTGLSLASFYDDRSLTSTYGEPAGDQGYIDNFVASTNIVIRNNRFTNITGNGLIWRVSNKPLIESNYFYNCAYELSGNAAFVFNTDSALFQYNEACYTPWLEGETDARGLDADYRTKNTIIQHNYLHHNGYGGVVATGGPNNSSLPTFNDGTIIRYNILYDNAAHDMRGSGQLTNLYFYNNTIVSTEASGNAKTIIVNDNWGDGIPDNQFYANNIFMASNSSTAVIDEGASTNNIFSHNCYEGFVAFNLPTSDKNKVVKNPEFNGDIDVDSIGTMDFSDVQEALVGFKLSETSPCIAAGTNDETLVNGMPETDFFGNTISSTINIGAHQIEELGSGVLMKQIDDELRLFPNPSEYFVNVNFNEALNERVQCKIFSLNGRMVYSETFNISNQHSFVVYLKDNAIITGAYLMQVETSANTYTRQLIVK